MQHSLDMEAIDDEQHGVASSECSEIFKDMGRDAIENVMMDFADYLNVPVATVAVHLASFTKEQSEQLRAGMSAGLRYSLKGRMQRVIESGVLSLLEDELHAECNVIHRFEEFVGTQQPRDSGDTAAGQEAESALVDESSVSHIGEREGIEIFKDMGRDAVEDVMMDFADYLHIPVAAVAGQLASYTKEQSEQLRAGMSAGLRYSLKGRMQRVIESGVLSLLEDELHAECNIINRFEEFVGTLQPQDSGEDAAASLSS